MEIEINKNYNVRRLQQFLDYELSTSMLYFLKWFWSIAILLMVIAAVLFTPYMLKVLFEEKKYGWIIFFIIIVVVPVICFLIIDIHSAFQSVLRLVTLALFYFYCFCLRMAIRGWKD
jgi:hypothetical protein